MDGHKSTSHSDAFLTFSPHNRWTSCPHIRSIATEQNNGHQLTQVCLYIVRLEVKSHIGHLIPLGAREEMRGSRQLAKKWA
ncbi:hypothetical protein TNCV_2948211 [Trichonephila clavipes]|nr:hypothetical protein TNCV_2948211 [Trichonephila clavipes]